MAEYRGVVRHVRYWRGAIHRWSTSYSFNGVASPPLDEPSAINLMALDDRLCFGVDATDGGTYECQLYNVTTGGPAVASHTAFDWTTPGDWVKYDGRAWTDAADTVFETNAEVALQVEWAGGLSSSGKPVKFRKWYHAVPQVAPASGGHDISATDLASLLTAATNVAGALAANSLVMGSGSGRFAGSASIVPFYGNHQMPRGRRRKALVTASGKYTGPTISLPVLPD